MIYYKELKKELDRLHGKRAGLALLAAALTLLLSGCFVKTVDELYTLPRHSDEYDRLELAIDAVLSGQSAVYSAPVSGPNQQSVQLADLDGDGQEEAIAVFGHDPRIYQTTVKEFLKDKNGNLNGIITVKLESKKDEKTGRMVMSEVPGSETKLDADLVLIAAGFLGTEKYVADAFGVELNARTNVSTAEGAYATSVKNVFAAGDVHRGQSLVVWAIREGRDAAKEVDEYLMGYTNLD